MPVDDFLKNYEPGDDFTFESFRDAVAAEYAADQTAWRAAVDQRDERITQTEADLKTAQAAAWTAYNRKPVTDEPEPDDVDPNSMDAIKARVFQPIERK
jgi:hypothetical protein